MHSMHSPNFTTDSNSSSCLQRMSRSTSESQSIRNSRSSVISSMSSESPTTPVPVVGRRIIPRDQILVQEEIGQGEFGVVKHALYTNDVGQKVRGQSVTSCVKLRSVSFTPFVAKLPIRWAKCKFCAACVIPWQTLAMLSPSRAI